MRTTDQLEEIWSLRIRLQLADKARDLALFNLAVDSKLRGCDLVSLRVRDVYQGSVVSSRAIVMQRKTQRPVQFEITEAGAYDMRLGDAHPTSSKIGEALKLAGIDSAASYLRQGEQLLHNFGHAVWCTGSLLFGWQE